MTNHAEKGRKNERRAQDLYEEAGYRAWSPQRSRWNDTDIYGLFDVLAVPVETDGPVVLAQVKTNGYAGIREFCRAAAEYESESVRVDFLTRHDGEPGPHTASPYWRLARPTCDGSGGYETVVDERKDGTPAEGAGVVDYLKSRPSGGGSA